MTSIRTQPSRHVDYLSHDWREEDIWSLWKLIVSRRGDYNNSARLEHASWISVFVGAFVWEVSRGTLQPAGGWCGWW